jgi:hypothetical protein
MVAGVITTTSSSANMVVTAATFGYPGANSFAKASDEERNLLALHATPKPVTMVADTLMDCSARHDIVLDSFLGSGSTVIAAERTARRCYGLELDPLYVDTTVRRWQDFTRMEARHASSGRTFNQMAAEMMNAAEACELEPDQVADLDTAHASTK